MTRKKKIILRFVPDDNSLQMICVTPEQVHLNATPSLIGSSFKEVMLKKINESHTSKSSKPAQKRKKSYPVWNISVMSNSMKLCRRSSKNERNLKIQTKIKIKIRFQQHK